MRHLMGYLCGILLLSQGKVCPSRLFGGGYVSGRGTKLWPQQFEVKLGHKF